MATIQVYDKVSDQTYSVTVNINHAVVAGESQGRYAFYVTLSTTATNPEGGTIPQRVMTDAVMAGAVSTMIRSQVADILAEISGVGGYEMSSSQSSLSSNTISTSSLTISSSQSSLSTTTIGLSTSSMTKSSQSTHALPSSVSSSISPD